MNNGYVDIVLVELEEEPKVLAICEAPLSSIFVGEEVEVNPGTFGKAISVLTSKHGETLYQFCCMVGNLEELPKVLRKRTYTTFDYPEEAAS